MPEKPEQDPGSLTITVTAGERGPVVFLSGEADLSAAAELTAVLLAQIDSGADHVTVNLSGLAFADSASLRAFIVAHHALERHGGSLVLDRPQPHVARVLGLLGMDQVLSVRGVGLEPDA